jgi:hypothetical protein
MKITQKCRGDPTCVKKISNNNGSEICLNNSLTYSKRPIDAQYYCTIFEYCNDWENWLEVTNHKLPILKGNTLQL